MPRWFGLSLAVPVLFAGAAAGVVQGGHLSAVVTNVRDLPDIVANEFGFRIASLSLSGEIEVSREDVLAAAGVTPRTSLLFLDAEAARGRLKAHPWIADATVLKFYPDRLRISIVERQAFALWQREGRVAVIAADGTVLETTVTQRFAALPLVVGRGAAQQAAEFLSLLDQFPHLRDQVRASILVAERRWNLRLKNGIDVRLPETDPRSAIEELVALDRDKKLLLRDIVAVDLRLPDRVTLQLSDSAAKAREEILKARKSKPKGSDA